MEKMDLIKELKRIKKQRGLTIDRLAKEMGIYPRTLYFWFAGKTKPSKLAARAILDFLEKIKEKEGK